MHGENLPNQHWLTNFKIAIVQKDTDKIIKLYNTMPEFDAPQEIEEISALLLEAIHLIHNEKQTIASQMQKLRKSKAFLQASNSTANPYFNQKS